MSKTTPKQYRAELLEILETYKMHLIDAIIDENPTMTVASTEEKEVKGQQQPTPTSKPLFSDGDIKALRDKKNAVSFKPEEQAAINKTKRGQLALEKFGCIVSLIKAVPSEQDANAGKPNPDLFAKFHLAHKEMIKILEAPRHNDDEQLKTVLKAIGAILCCLTFILIPVAVAMYRTTGKDVNDQLNAMEENNAACEHKNQ